MPVSLRDWMRQSYEDLRSDLTRGLMHTIYTAYLSVWFSVTSRRPIGFNMYDEPWDMVIVLDGCRTDLLAEIASEYDFINDIETRWSVGSHSREWLTNTFTESYRDEIEETTLVTGNPHTQTVFRDRTFPPKETIPFASLNWSTVEKDAFNEVFSHWESHRTDGYGVLPRPITDRAISEGRSGDTERLIVHYMQPHIPYIGTAVDSNRELTSAEKDGWRAVKNGTAHRSDVWEAYKDNLRYILTEVELLLSNVEANRVCITADHGNAFGEFGVYGHPEGFPHPYIKRVPWVETTAQDSGTYEPKTPEKVTHEGSEEILKDLGYL